MKQQGNSQSVALQRGGASGVTQVSVRGCGHGARRADVLVARKGNAMQTENLVLPMARATSKARRKERGVFEKVPGSGVWWIRYIDAQGRFRREKVGTWTNARDLYH